jgi:hypothetical protein
MKRLSRKDLQKVFYIGRKLTLTNCLMGPTNKPRIIAHHHSYGYSLWAPDKGPSALSYLRFGKGDVITFSFLTGVVQIHNAEGELAAEYKLSEYDGQQVAECKLTLSEAAQ